MRCDLFRRASASGRHARPQTLSSRWKTHSRCGVPVYTYVAPTASLHLFAPRKQAPAANRARIVRREERRLQSLSLRAYKSEAPPPPQYINARTRRAPPAVMLTCVDTRAWTRGLQRPERPLKAVCDYVILNLPSACAWKRGTHLNGNRSD